MRTKGRQTFTYDEGTHGKCRLTRINNATGQTDEPEHRRPGRGWQAPNGEALHYGYEGYGRLSSISRYVGGQ